jgi:hypothetical protein
MPQKSRSKEHADFLRMAYCGLLLRGYNSEREIPDPILRKVWRLGKRVNDALAPRSAPGKT